MPSTYPLRPINMINTGPPRITATAGTRLVGTSPLAYMHIVLTNSRLLHFCSHLRNVTRLSFRSFPNIPYHCPAYRDWAFCIPSVTDRPLRPVKRNTARYAVITPTTHVMYVNIYINLFFDSLFVVYVITARFFSNRKNHRKNINI